MGKKYSLANYIVSIKPDDAEVNRMFGTISIGGEGSYMGSVVVSMAKALWTTTGYATGAWTHTKSLDKTGTCAITLSQLADEVIKFIKLCKLYYSGDYAGCTISVSDIAGNRVALCEDCYIDKMADQQFEDAPRDQQWTFTCGKITLQ